MVKDEYLAFSSFSFLTKDGSYLPLMAERNRILKFDLIDLNNPQALERQKQRLLEAISESPWGGQ